MPPLTDLVNAATSGRRPADVLLLDVAEALHASARTARQVGQDLGESSSRVREALRALVDEGIVAPAGGGPGRLARFTLTGAGAEALARRGRFPGDVVVLFTDLVASTQMIAEHGEIGAHERRIRHFALLRAAISRAGGYEVKGLGDGVMVAFPDASVALACAADMQRSVAADPDGLGLRVGLHMGPVLRDGDDLHGTTVITASRLCDQADSGQTLLSGAVREAGGHLLDGRVRAVGDKVLKGLAEPVPTYELIEGLPGRGTSGRSSRGSSSRRDRLARTESLQA
jgi:class 3 adenylate cyclase